MEPSIIVTEDNKLFKFTLSGVNVSIANALRRFILNDIPLTVIRTETHDENKCNITKNNCRLHNEILKQRLSCIPIHVEYDMMDEFINKYILEVDVKNNTDNTILVTTEHFRIKHKVSKNYLTIDEQKKIFPPFRSNYYIEFARLRPKISDTIPGEELQFTAEFSIATANTNSMFNSVSKCAYGNSPDKEKIDEKWNEVEEELKQKDMSEKDINFSKKNFYILDAQRYYIENSYDFVIRSVGVYENNFIVKIASQLLSDKFTNYCTAIDNDFVPVFNSNNTIPYSFDIHLKNEDYTMGKVLEYIIYSKYFEDEKTLSFCGFQKYHPHDTHSVIRLSFKEKMDKNMALHYLRDASEIASGIFKKIFKLIK